LALKHGTSLTINPQTGLPEAFKLKSLLPMIAGAALGPAGFALFSTSLGAAAAIGGLSALTSGSLSKGLMDGLSAYGGSSLASGFSTVGANAAGNAAANAELANIGPSAATETAMSASQNAIAEATKSPFSTIGSGISESFSDPSKLKTAMGGWGNVAGAAIPVAGALMADEATPTVTQMPTNGYIRNFDYDPTTQRARALDPVKVSSLGYADGGKIGQPDTTTRMPDDSSSPIVPDTQPAAKRALQNNMTGASRAAFDYLTGASDSVGPPPPAVPDMQTAPNFIPKSTNVDTSTGRYVWDTTTNAYKWTDSNNPLVTKAAPIAEPVSYGGGEVGGAAGGVVAYAQGGLGQLGGYSDGGQLLKGPGDGVSDSIPATIGNKQPARLADGEFVVPARIVSELGNGSTEAGARKLYQMMDRIQAARSKTVGKGRVAKNSRADKYLPE
jgi:hypothetical protein